MGEPARLGHGCRLQQQAAKEAVEHAGIQRLQRRRQFVEAPLELVEFGVRESSWFHSSVGQGKRAHTLL